MRLNSPTAAAASSFSSLSLGQRRPGDLARRIAAPPCFAPSKAGTRYCITFPSSRVTSGTLNPRSDFLRWIRRTPKSSFVPNLLWYEAVVVFFFLVVYSSSSLETPLKESITISNQQAAHGILKKNITHQSYLNVCITWNIVQFQITSIVFLLKNIYIKSLTASLVLLGLI